MEYNDIVRKDLQLHWEILEFCNRIPWISDNLKIITSKYPWQDICIILWIACIVGVIEIGVHFFWVTSFNLCISFVIRKLLEAKRPLEFDRRFKPLTDTNAESFGFPSLESYMAVVISLALAEKFPYLWFYCVAFVVTFLVGFTRIFSRARFPHQIAGSYMLGYVGFKLVNRYVLSNLTMKKVERFTQHSGVAFMLMIGIAYLAMNMENNESRLLSVPKHEFTRVLADIMNGTSTPINDYKNNRKGVTKNSEGIYPGNLDRRVNREIVTPRSAAIQKAIHNEEMKSKKYYATVKHDSFYFLQKSLMKRNGKEANVYSDAMYGTDDEDMDTPRSNGHTPRSHISKMF